MTLHTALLQGTRLLEDAGIAVPRLTAEVLLAHALGCDRVRLYLDFEKPLGPDELARFRDLVQRRAAGEPTAYLVGAKEFCGRRFRTDARALVPRPETELLVEAALEALPAEGLALDLCAGSGCVGATLALERPGARVVAVEMAPDALELARENAALLGARNLELLQGDLYEPLAPGLRFHVVAANAPYVPTRELAGLARELHHEPRVALDGGPDGLDVLRRIVAGAPERLAPGGTLALEMHETHGPALLDLCRGAGFAVAETRRDLAGLPRLVVARAPGAPAGKSGNEVPAG